MTGNTYNVGILVVSDTCAAKTAEDTSGLNLREILNKHQEKVFVPICYDIVSDDIEAIKAKLCHWSDNLKLGLILTTGGSGFSPRDVTPEATKMVIDKEANSLATAILVESLKITKFAMLSRAVSGIRKNTLIINLPGSKKGSQESLEIVLPVLKHALDLMNDSKQSIRSDHAKIQEVSHNCSKHSLNKSTVTSEDIVNKPRKSDYPMISVDEALSHILTRANVQEVEEVFYLNALGRVCAENILAKEPLPPFAASIKDGFACRLTSLQKESIHNKQVASVKFDFTVVGAANAGDGGMSVELEEGQCVKINTGGPVPLNADIVIQIEDTVSLDKNKEGKDTKIEIIGSTVACGGKQTNEINIKLGQDIRPIGFDIKIGEFVVKERSIIRSPQIGICATVGALNLKVFKTPSVALVSTGNELQKPNEATLAKGQIRDSNKSLLSSALASYGIREVKDAGIATDEPDSVFSVFKSAMNEADIVISTGGVSMGDKDLVKDVLIKDFDCSIHFARLNMKPGKPTTFATCTYNGKKKFLFCLPGNPVSAIVTFNLLVVPCIKKMMGHMNTMHTEIKVKCEFDADLDPRPEYHRAFATWSNHGTESEHSSFPRALSTGNQHSSRLLSMNEANCLVKLPGRTKEKSTVSKGEVLSALVIEKI